MSNARNIARLDVNSTGELVIDTNSTDPALRITQTGAGNALVVEDSSPDSTPFVINTSGKVFNGYTTLVSGDDYNGTNRTGWNYQSHNTSGTANLSCFSWTTTAVAGAGISLARSRGTTVGTQDATTIVQSGDDLGGIGFTGDDGASTFIVGASIKAQVDGTPGTDDMPGRLVFSTTADGASSPTERMRIDSSGNVGIGTAYTSLFNSVGGTTRLAVCGSSSSTDILGNTGASIAIINTDQTANNTAGLHFARADTDDTPNYAGASIVAQFPEAQVTGQYPKGLLAFLTSNATNSAPTEKMRIDSSGNLLVGTTSGNSGIQSKPNSGNCFTTIDHITGTASGEKYTWFFYNGSGIGSITQNGTTGVSYNTSSDYRLKENIAPMTGALSVVQQLKPCTYTWKADGSDGQGFIAHELQEVVPDCVTGEKDAVETYVDENGNEQTRPVYQGIDTSFLVATLTAAIQEQQAIINALTTRIEALENPAAQQTP